MMGLNAQMLPVASDYRSMSAALRPIIPDIINDIKLTGAAYRTSGVLPNSSFAPQSLLMDLLPAVKLSDAAYEGTVFPEYNVTVMPRLLPLHLLNLASNLHITGRLSLMLAHQGSKGIFIVKKISSK